MTVDFLNIKDKCWSISETDDFSFEAPLKKRKLPMVKVEPVS